MKKILIFIITSLPLLLTQAQGVPDLINDGVDLYNKKEYTESEVNFLKGLEKEPDSFEAKFNLGDTYYKQQKYDDAAKTFNSVLGQADNKELKAKVFHNIGNSLLKSQKIQESIDAYKNALKNNPDDADTKYNLSYALSLLNKQNQQKNNDQKNDKNKDKDKQDQNKQEGDNDKKDQQKQDQNKQENKPQQDQESQQDNLKQPQKNEISKEEAQRILDALKNNEKDLQKKLRKKTGVPVKTEKDW
jgi:tetratricopeptide (TPR) repeat protein